MKKQLILLPLFTILTACVSEPTVFDVPKQTWDSLSIQQKQQTIQNYNERHAVINYQNCYYKHCWNN